MFKRCLLLLLAASVISFAATIAVAQDNSSNTPPSSAPMGNDHYHHGPMDPAQHAEMLAKHLKLTSDQQAKVQEIFQTEHSQMENLREDTTLSKQDMHSKMMDMHKNTMAQVRAVLDPGQQKKFDEMQTRHEQWGEHHHGGPPAGDQQTPPQPQ